MEKKTSCLLCVLTALLLAVLYLWAALRPGVWLRDAFLYRQADGSFSGKDAYAAYTMQIAQTETVRKWISRWTERRGTIGSNRKPRA